MMALLRAYVARYIVRGLALLVVANIPLAFAQAPKPAASAKAPVPMKTYKDPLSGVSFQYPFVWKKLPVTAFKGDRRSAPWGYEPPILYQDTFSLTAVLAFPAEGTIFAKTDLDVLYFIFTTTFSAACGTFGEIHPPVKIAGVIYFHNDVNDDSCAASKVDIYSTLRGDTCYVFELDNFHKCDPNAPGVRKLSASENKALQKHLDDILQSIHFDK